MDLRQTALDLFQCAVKAADPYDAVFRCLRVVNGDIIIDGIHYPSDRYTSVIVIGGGKASARMGQAVEDILGKHITSGWINTKDGHGIPLHNIRIHECGHPVPDERGVEGTHEIISLLEKADENTLVICLLSGGGSALMPAPAPGISLADKQAVTRLLLGAGASIGEVNTLRKHLSTLKGGGMALLAAPAALHVLILSDVIGDRLDTIASGPAVGDPTTFADCLAICDRYAIRDELPSAVLERFIAGQARTLRDTLKPGDQVLSAARNSLIGNNRLSVEVARNRAREMGYTTLVLSTALEGEASVLGTVYASLASEIQASGNPIPSPACIIGGGEPTVTIRGSGLGGRNQELALATARGIAGMRDVVFLSGGTDGTDGPTDAAGGIVDGATTEKGAVLGLSIDRFLADNDSYHYLKEVDGLIITGPTGTNVMDIHLLLVGKPG